MNHKRAEALSVTEQEPDLCFCGASPDEHERAFMHYYLFGDKPDTIFEDGAKSLGDIEVSHYYLLLDYLSKSEFVYEGHRRYFAKEFLRAHELHAQVSSKLQVDLFDALERKWADEHASCTPRSQSWLRFGAIFATLVRVSNGTHIHRFRRTMGGSLYCSICGSRFSGHHDLGELVVRGSISVPRRRFGHGCCVRCGSLPSPYLVSRARIRLRRWYRTGVRGSMGCWTQVRRPVPWSLLMIALGGVFSNWIAGWWHM